MEQFKPNWKSPPGDTIKDLMEEYGVDIRGLSIRTKIPESRMRGLINGDVKIDDDIAQMLSDVFGSTKEFWLERERQYQR